MTKLQWISEKDLDSAISTLHKRAEKALQNTEINQKKNVVDPFYSLLITSTFKIKQKSDLLELQNQHSALRGMSNAIGTFHQSVLGSISGWKNHDAGYDLENPKKMILAEIKNKHNTMSNPNKNKVGDDLITALKQKRGCWKGYLVFILPKRGRYRKSLKVLGRGQNKKELYEIDGMSFYEMVTEDKSALNNLFNILCERLSVNREITAYCKEIMTKNYL